MFYCTRLRRFQEQIQQKQKDLWNSGDEYSVGGKSNASSQSKDQGEGRRVKSDKIKPK